MNVKKFILIPWILTVSLFAASANGTLTKEADLPLPESSYKYIVAKCHSIDMRYTVELLSNNRINAMPVFMNHNVIGRIGKQSFFLLTLNKNFYNGKSFLLARLIEREGGKIHLFNADALKVIPVTEGQVYGDKKPTQHRVSFGGTMTFDLRKSQLYINESEKKKATVVPGFCEKVR